MLTSYQEHAWVTKGGQDPLLSAEENCSDLVELPTEAELRHAITGNMKQLLVVVRRIVPRHAAQASLTQIQMKAVKHFKTLLSRKRPELMEGTFSGSRLVAPPFTFRPVERVRKVQSLDGKNRTLTETVLATEGIHHGIDVSEDLKCSPETLTTTKTKESPVDDQGQSPQRKESEAQRKANADMAVHTTAMEKSMHAKGQAHDPLTETLFLDIGAGSDSVHATSDGEHVLSESPGAVELNVYETAYQEEMQRILVRRGRTEPAIFLTRRVEGNKEIREHESVIAFNRQADSKAMGGGTGILAGLVQAAKEHKESEEQEEDGKGNA